MEKAEVFDKSIKSIGKVFVAKEKVKFILYVSSQEQGFVLRAQARTKNLECGPWECLSGELLLEVPSSAFLTAAIKRKSEVI